MKKVKIMPFLSIEPSPPRLFLVGGIVVLLRAYGAKQEDVREKNISKFLQTDPAFFFHEMLIG